MYNIDKFLSDIREFLKIYKLEQEKKNKNICELANSIKKIKTDFFKLDIDTRKIYYFFVQINKKYNKNKKYVNSHSIIFESKYIIGFTGTPKDIVINYNLRNYMYYDSKLER
jgi:hypothetical protein